MKNEVKYQWWVETFTPDEYEDIEECEEIDLWELPITPPVGLSARLCLRRLTGNDTDGITDIGYAYLNGDTLEDNFDSGHKVPQKYKNQLRKIKIVVAS